MSYDNNNQYGSTQRSNQGDFDSTAQSGQGDYGRESGYDDTGRQGGEQGYENTGGGGLATSKNVQDLQSHDFNSGDAANYSASGGRNINKADDLGSSGQGNTGGGLGTSGNLRDLGGDAETYERTDHSGTGEYTSARDKPGVQERIRGGAEVLIGKVTRNEDLEEKGQQRKSEHDGY